MLTDLLSQPESKVLEFKENATSADRIIKTVIAFANTAGGKIIIGVKDKDHSVVGINNILQEEERLASLITESIKPMMIPDIDIVSYNNKELIMINVPYLTGPYYLKNSGLHKGVFIRLGSTNRLADSETISYLQRLAKNISFDEMACVTAKLEELNTTQIRNVLKKSYKKLDKKHYQSLGIIAPHAEKMYATYGGILLFGYDRLKWLPDSLLRCVCFAGIGRSDIVDQKDIASPLTDAVDEAIAFIHRHTNLSAKFTGGARRIDVHQFPLEAIREAVVNAIVHADYAMKGGSIQIAVFSNRIEITNPGGLAFGQSMENALLGVSRMRNRLIGRIFREVKIIEQLGTGLQRILEAYQDYPECQPVIEEMNNHFRVVLFETKSIPNTLKTWESQLLKLLADGKQLSAKDIAEFWGVSDRTARNRLQIMLGHRVIKRHGKATNDPNTRYSIA
ncbi:MAG: putative DNA binding domain-containing protein [Gammaproteobacteria bacterium]|nr:putative DNA binding domain-containing protein [Gammaproteobacteria bacterium]